MPWGNQGHGTRPNTTTGGEVVNDLSPEGKDATSSQGSGVTSPKDDGQGATKAREEIVAAWLAMLKDPKLLAMTSAQQRGLIESHYAQLFKQLGLNGDASQQLVNLLVDRRNAGIDLAASAQATDPQFLADPTAFGDAVKSAQTDINDQIASLLGPSAYSAFQQYDQNLISNQLVAKVQTLLNGGGDPLTETQKAQLQATFDQLGARSPTQNVVEAAQSFLDQTQVQALQQIRQQQVNSVQIRNLQMQYQQASGSLVPLTIPK